MSLVSVVIPTLRRPKLLLRALDSVFNQTYEQIEVIVVADGRDDETPAVLLAVKDPRLHVILGSRSLTAAGARNDGVGHAKGEWLAFLDDDDEWLPRKLEKQMALAAGRGLLLVTCLSKVITATSTFISPDVIYDNTIPVDEYLFDRRSLFGGLSLLQTSSYLLPRTLFDRAPFRVDSEHDDWEFVIRLSKQSGVRIETVPEVLVVLHHPAGGTGGDGTWRARLAWIDRMRPSISPRAYSGFCLGAVGSQAAKERSRAGFFLLLYRAFKYGSPRPWQILNFVVFWVLRQDTRSRLRALFRDRPYSPLHSKRPESG
jgi:glycosyltransferase involved in cell wall biosynthesis